MIEAQSKTSQSEKTTGHSYASWYWVKYLGLTCTIAFILALINLWRWPPDGYHTKEGLVFLGISILCVIVTKHRLLVLIAPLVIIASRGVIAAVLGVHPVESSTIAVITGILFWVVAKSVARKYKDFPIPDGYPLREIGMDIVVMAPVVVLIYFLHEIMQKWTAAGGPLFP